MAAAWTRPDSPEAQQFRRKSLTLEDFNPAQKRLAGPPAPVQKWGLKFGCGCKDFTYQQEASEVGTRLSCPNGCKGGQFVAESWGLFPTRGPRPLVAPSEEARPWDAEEEP